MELPVITCEGCGKCCEKQGTPPFSHAGDDKPPPELEWDIDAHADRYDRGLPCLWFDTETKKCNHYEHRPDACRNEVNPGDYWCRSFRGELLPGETEPES